MVAAFGEAGMVGGGGGGANADGFIAPGGRPAGGALARAGARSGAGSGTASGFCIMVAALGDGVGAGAGAGVAPAGGATPCFVTRKGFWQRGHLMFTPAAGTRDSSMS